MDPTACLRRLLQAIREGNKAVAADAATDLSVWLQNGGILPSVIQLQEACRDVNE